MAGSGGVRPIIYHQPETILPQRATQAWTSESIADAVVHYSRQVDVTVLQEKQILLFAQEIGAGAPVLQYWVELADDLVPEAVPGRGRPAPPSGLGDINQDGYVNWTDFQLAATLFGGLTGTSEQRRRADVNADGVIDILDLTAISLYIGGNIDFFAADAAWPSYVRLGVVQTIAPSGVTNTRHSVPVPWTVHSRYARLAVQTPVIVANTSWRIRAVFSGKQV